MPSAVFELSNSWCFIMTPSSRRSSAKHALSKMCVMSLHSSPLSTMLPVASLVPSAVKISPLICTRPGITASCFA